MHCIQWHTSLGKRKKTPCSSLWSSEIDPLCIAQLGQHRFRCPHVQTPMHKHTWKVLWIPTLLAVCRKQQLLLLFSIAVGKKKQLLWPSFLCKYHPHHKTTAPLHPVKTLHLPFQCNYWENSVSYHLNLSLQVKLSPKMIFVKKRKDPNQYVHLRVRDNQQQ